MPTDGGTYEAVGLVVATNVRIVRDVCSSGCAVYSVLLYMSLYINNVWWEFCSVCKYCKWNFSAIGHGSKLSFLHFSYKNCLQHHYQSKSSVGRIETPTGKIGMFAADRS